MLVMLGELSRKLRCKQAEDVLVSIHLREGAEKEAICANCQLHGDSWSDFTCRHRIYLSMLPPLAAREICIVDPGLVEVDYPDICGQFTQHEFSVMLS